MILFIQARREEGFFMQEATPLRHCDGEKLHFKRAAMNPFKYICFVIKTYSVSELIKHAFLINFAASTQ